MASRASAGGDAKVGVRRSEHVAVDVESWRRVERCGRTERESDDDDHSVRATGAEKLRGGEDIVSRGVAEVVVVTVGVTVGAERDGEDAATKVRECVRV